MDRNLYLIPGSTVEILVVHEKGSEYEKRFVETVSADGTVKLEEDDREYDSTDFDPIPVDTALLKHMKFDLYNKEQNANKGKIYLELYNGVWQTVGSKIPIDTLDKLQMLHVLFNNATITYYPG